MMAGIGGKNTKPEIILRRALHRAGFRFRLHVRELPGKPDVVLPRYRVVILVHGCFWHRHHGCHWCTDPAANSEFWKSKFDRNVERDAEIAGRLHKAGWRIARVWECGLRGSAEARTIDDLLRWLPSAERDFDSGLIRARGS